MTYFLVQVSVYKYFVNCKIWLHFVFFPEASNKILGDFMVLAGAVLYGTSNVGQEYVIRSFDRVEFLGMIGMFGSIVNGVQL